jgi:hypothetical protein
VTLSQTALHSVSKLKATKKISLRNAADNGESLRKQKVHTDRTWQGAVLVQKQHTRNSSNSQNHTSADLTKLDGQRITKEFLKKEENGEQ